MMVAPPSSSDETYGGVLKRPQAYLLNKAVRPAIQQWITCTDGKKWTI